MTSTKNVSNVIYVSKCLASKLAFAVSIKTNLKFLCGFGSEMNVFVPPFSFTYSHARVYTI
jgi:hypothetical protein